MMVIEWVRSNSPAALFGSTAVLFRSIIKSYHYKSPHNVECILSRGRCDTVAIDSSEDVANNLSLKIKPLKQYKIETTLNNILLTYWQH